VPQIHKEHLNYEARKARLLGRLLQSLERPCKALYPGRIPLAKALVLCPEQFWGRWIGQLQLQFPLLQTHPGATAYLNPFKPVTWDCEGRLSLPSLPSNYAGIGKGVPIILIGKEYYLEVWVEKEFNKILEDCEAALAKTDTRQPNDQDPTRQWRIRTPGSATL
jgi:DNA-binding transcriptional regulator/RsmH inhibitor MraZ